MFWKERTWAADIYILSSNLTLHKLYRENQYINRELAEVTTQRDERARMVEGLTARLAYFEEVVGVQQKEKEDLMHTYRAACSENERCQV